MLHMMFFTPWGWAVTALLFVVVSVALFKTSGLKAIPIAFGILCVIAVMAGGAWFVMITLLRWMHS